MDIIDEDDYDGASQLAQYLSTKNRPLRMYLGMADGPTDALLLPQRIDGYEAVCDGIEMRIYCVALDAQLPLKEFIGLAVEVQLVTDQGNLRSIGGIVAEASQGESDGGLATYQLVMRDALAILDLDVNTRVFLNQSELDVVQTVLGEARRSNPALAALFEFEIDTALGVRAYPRRQQIIQCNEGTGAFVRRLLRRRGISWFFRAGRATVARDFPDDAPCTLAHAMVLFHDATRLKPSSAGTIRFHRNSATEQRDTLTAWTGARKLRPGRLTRFSWDYGNPRSPRFMAASVGSDADQGVKGGKLAAPLDHYLTEPPNVREGYEDLYTMAQQNMVRSDFEAKCYHAEGGVRDCGPGEYFILDGHPDVDSHPDAQRQFVILSQHLTAQNNLPKGFDARVDRLFSRNRWNLDAADLPLSGRNWFDSGELRFLTRLTCVRRDIAFVPAYDPRVDLPHPVMQSVIVVGPPGEEVHCDSEHRVKIRFLATRPPDHAHAEGAGASGTDIDSAWVRVLNPWAGSAASGGFLGARFLPRVGTEAMVAFLGGDPDQPVLLGQFFNAAAHSPYLGLGDLPGERYVSGLKSCEIGGRRANQLRLDDTSGQISAQLSSEHGRSELNLGWLSQPRDQGIGKARGEGAELSTDEQLALRAGKGVLLSAWARLNGGGQQLDRADYLALMEDCLALFRSLGQYAAQNQGLPVDDQPQGEAQAAMRQWDSGSNTAPNGAGGGAAAIAVTAPAGISFATSKAIVSYAAANIDTVAQQHLQMTAGQRYTVNAGKGVSLFAQHDGLSAIAHFGKLLLQSQHDDTQINAAKNMTFTAGDGKLVGMAKEILLISESGSFIRLGDDITFGTKGNIVHHGAKFIFAGPSTMPVQFPTFGSGNTDLKFAATYFSHGADALPAADLPVKVGMTDTGDSSGQSDEGGKSDLLQSDAMKIATIKVVGKP